MSTRLIDKMNNELINVSKGELMKKLILIASLLMASNLYAEQKLCSFTDIGVNFMGHIKNLSTLGDTLEEACKAGDVIKWSFEQHYAGGYLIALACHQEKQITASSDLTEGACTYTGKILEDRGEEYYYKHGIYPAHNLEEK